MSDNSKIEWTDASWNPVRARNAGTRKVGWSCVHHSPGCLRCYAEAMNRRLGTGLSYRKAQPAEPFLDPVAVERPLRWKRPRFVFVCSMTDLFGDWVPDGWVDRVFAVMAMARQHTFQVLTKRADRMLAYLTKRWVVDDVSLLLREVSEGTCDLPAWPLPNVWLGASVEDRQHGLPRVGALRRCPAAVRFLSVEPLLEDLGVIGLDGIGWCVVGGESGPGARPCRVEWVRSVVRQCKAAGTACFVKQLGSQPVPDLADPTGSLRGYGAIADTARAVGRHLGVAVPRWHPKGGDPEQWPADLRVRQFPAAAPGVAP